MNRRSFLRLFAAAAPVAAVAPTYFFAPVGGWKSDVIVNPEAYLTMEAVRKFQANMERVMMVSNPSGPSWFKERFVGGVRRVDQSTKADVTLRLLLKLNKGIELNESLDQLDYLFG